IASRAGTNGFTWLIEAGENIQLPTSPSGSPASSPSLRNSHPSLSPPPPWLLKEPELEYEEYYSPLYFNLFYYESSDSEYWGISKDELLGALIMSIVEKRPENLGERNKRSIDASIM